MFLHPTCNHVSGIIDAIIEKNSSPAPTADKNITTVTYDPTTILNKRFLKKLSDRDLYLYLIGDIAREMVN